MIIILLYTILLIISIFVVVFADSFVVTLAGYPIFIILFLLIVREENKKFVLPYFFMVSIILDVVNHYKIGTNFLLAMICYMVIELVKKMFSLYSGIVLYIIEYVALTVYFILIKVIPQYLLTNVAGYLTKGVIVNSLLKALFSVVLLFVVDLVSSNFVNNRRNNSKIRLK